MTKNFRNHRNWRNALLAAAILLAGNSLSLAVHPQSWVHQTQRDYVEGRFDNLVVDNYGILSLGRPLSEIEFAEETGFINSFAQTPDGKVFFGTSSDGAVYVVKNTQAEIYFAAPDETDQILSLAVNKQGHLLVAICGAEGGAKLVELIPDAQGKPVAKTLFEKPNVNYIWTIKPTPDGSIYLGTGPKGQVWKIAADGSASVLLEATAKNILNLTFDKQGNLLAGTDGQGLVIRVDAKTTKPFVLLEAGELDISALATDAAGNIYAAATSPRNEGGAMESEPKTSHPGEVDPEEDSGVENEDQDDSAIITDQPTTIPSGSKKNQKSPPPPTPPTTAPQTEPVSRLSPSPLALPDGIFTAEIPHTLPEQARPFLPPGMNVPPNIRMIMEKSAMQTRPRPPVISRSQRSSNSGKNTSSRGVRASADDETVEGNAIYKITPDGVVTVVFHGSENILSMLVKDQELIVGTGTEGKLYSIRPDTEAQTLIGRLNSENIMSLYAAKDGSVYCGTSNPATVFKLGANVAAQGTFVSDVLDAKHTATWGSSVLNVTLPEGAGSKATLAVRTGNVKEIKKHVALWSNWTPEITASGDVGTKVDQTAARYLQYRITLQADAKGHSPTVEQVKLSYQIENLPPRIKELAVEDGSAKGESENSGQNSSQANNSSETEGSSKSLPISWEVTDGNQDELVFRLYFREIGSSNWLPLAKDIKESEYDWPIAGLPEGKYQVKLVASDSPDNSPDTTLASAKVSAPFVVATTPPALGDVKSAVEAGKVTLNGMAHGKLLPISEIRYQIDGQGDWQPAVASDKIFDSPTEGFTLTTRTLPAGAHQLTLKVTDARGNIGYQVVTVSVK